MARRNPPAKKILCARRVLATEFAGSVNLSLAGKLFAAPMAISVGPMFRAPRLIGYFVLFAAQSAEEIVQLDLPEQGKGG